MEDNANNEPVDVPPNFQTERSSEQSTSSPESNGLNKIEEIKTMEVHHHPDLHHKKKKFKEYILEFIMIFLAVTLGFFAESLREHISENNRAKEYAFMLLKDVIQDTIRLHSTMAHYQDFINSTDTLLQLRRNKKDKMDDVDFFFYSRNLFLAGRMSFNDATLLQVKNSGNLRYFHSLRLKEKIGEYDNITRDFVLRQEIELNWVPIIEGFYNNLFDYDIKTVVAEKLSKGYTLDSLKKEHYNFVIKNPEEINQFFNFCDYRKNVWVTRITLNINPTLEVARQLIALLKNEYDFSENEQN